MMCIGYIQILHHFKEGTLASLDLSVQKESWNHPLQIPRVDYDSFISNILSVCKFSCCSRTEFLKVSQSRATQSPYIAIIYASYVSFHLSFLYVAPPFFLLAIYLLKK